MRLNGREVRGNNSLNLIIENNKFNVHQNSLILFIILISATMKMFL